MAVDTIEVALVANTWTQVTTADGEYQFSANEPIRYAYGTTQPAAGFIGHFLPENQSRVDLIDTGRFLWALCPTGAATVAVTKSW